MRRAAAFLMLLTALAVPSTAVAQSAGDEQYSDPFGPEEPQQQEEPQAEEQPAEEQPVQPAEPVEQAPSVEPAAGSSGDVAAAPAQSGDPSLPVTGLPALSMFVVGAGLLAAGAVVRRRL
jgi:hypothetical protein